jgi:MFS family permease
MRSARLFKRGWQGRPGLSLPFLLLSTTLLDELLIGFLFVGLPLIRDRLHLSYGQVGLIFTAGGISALVIEPIFMLPSDRWPKRWPVVGGALALAVGFVLAGAAPSYAWLLLAVAVIFPAGGAAVALAQAALVDLDPAGVVPMMARWTVLGSVGDLLCPAVFGLLLALGFRWPALCVLAAGCWLALAAAVAPRRFPQPAPALLREDGEEERLFAAFRIAATDPRILRWVTVEFGASLLDETFLGFAALYLRDHLHATPGEIGFLLLPGAIAGLLSLLCLERLLRHWSGARMLPWLALLCLAGTVLLLLAPSLWLACCGLVLADAGAAGWYPIAQAAAYECFPGRPGLVNTVTKLPEPLDLAVPALLGLLAAGAGLGSAMLIFVLAPIGVFLLGLRTRARPGA